jgi:hypothetical protein
MRGRVAVAVAAGMLIVSAIPAMAQEQAEVEPQRVEVPEAGMAISFPADWGVDIEMREREDWGLIEDDDEAPLVFWNVVYASAGGRPWCDVTWYPTHPISLEEHALLYEALMTPSHSDVERSIEVVPMTLPAGEAYRFVVYNEPTDDWTTTYLLDTDAGRYLLQCAGDERAEDDWVNFAEGLEPLSITAKQGSVSAQDEEAGTGDAAAHLERIEMPGAGIALSLPSDFVVEIEAESFEMGLPPDGSTGTSVTAFLNASAPIGITCGLELYKSNPLSLEEHVSWVEEVNLAQPDFEGTVEHMAVSLPVGDAIRIDGHHPADGIWTTMYLFDHGVTRYMLYCLDNDRAIDDYRSIAETIELLDPPPASVPVDAVSWDEIGQFPITVAVSDDMDAGWMMNAWCDRALWIENRDGTFEERLRCELTDDPVEPPEAHGTPPSETRITSGGSCEWLSDYWSNNDGSQYYATAWSMSVMTSGTVLAVSTYDAEALDCPVG